MAYKQSKRAKVFLEKAYEVHGDKYDYSKVNYVNGRTSVVIGYNGKWYSQLPKNHLQGARPEFHKPNMGTDEFIRRAKIKHGDKYDYSRVVYVNQSTEVEIGYNGKWYKQKPQHHLISTLYTGEGDHWKKGTKVEKHDSGTVAWTKK